MPTRAALHKKRRVAKDTGHELKTRDAYFSAAALCIHFLGVLDNKTRLSIKHILLEENRRSYTVPKATRWA